MSEPTIQQQQEAAERPLDNHSKLPALPNDLIKHILSFLPSDEATTLPTLLACQLVSGAFSAASKHDSIWSPLYDARWSSKEIMVLNLPECCTEEDQRQLMAIVSTSSSPLSSIDLFKVHFQLDALALHLLDQLVNDPSPGRRLSPFLVLAAISSPIKPILDRAIKGSLLDDVDAGKPEQYRWWAQEVVRCAERRIIAMLWRDASRSARRNAATVAKATEIFVTLGFLVGATEEDTEGFASWSMGLALQAVCCGLGRLDPDDPWKGYSETFKTENRDKMPIRPYEVLRTIRRALQLQGIKPPSTVDEVVPLEANFPHLVRKAARERTENPLFQMGLAMLEERKASQTTAESTDVTQESLTSGPTNMSWPLYIALVCAIVSHLRGHLGLEIAPCLDKDQVRILHWKGEKPSTPGRYWFSFEEGRLLNQREYLDQPPKETLDVFGMLHRLSEDIGASLDAAEKTGSRPQGVAAEYARYAQLLIPSVITQGITVITPEEMVLRVTGSALKLAAHLARYFPFDLPLLDELIAPLLGTEVAKSHWKDAIEQVKQQDTDVAVKGRQGEGDHPKFRIGDVVRCSQGWIGVVAGWDKSFDEVVYESIEPASSADDDGTRDQQQPSYHILSSDQPTPHFSFTHYVAEDKLSLVIAPKSDELKSLSQPDGFGRWFGILVSAGEGYRFTLSAEALARYPDDGPKGDGVSEQACSPLNEVE